MKTEMKRIILESNLRSPFGHPFVGWKPNGQTAAHFSDLSDCKRFGVAYVRDEHTGKIFRVRGNRLQTLIDQSRIEFVFRVNS